MTISWGLYLQREKKDGKTQAIIFSRTGGFTGREVCVKQVTTSASITLNSAGCSKASTCIQLK